MSQVFLALDPEVVYLFAVLLPALKELALLQLSLRHEAD